jgi:multicomponent K+:H+ antiporter subunit F
MTDIAVTIALVAFGVALLLNLLRLAKGPTIADRILALDTMVINAIVLLALFGIRYGTALYFEVALLLAMVGFVSTVALCRFVLRGDVIE